MMPFELSTQLDLLSTEHELPRPVLGMRGGALSVPKHYLELSRSRAGTSHSARGSTSHGVRPRSTLDQRPPRTAAAGAFTARRHPTMLAAADPPVLIVPCRAGGRAGPRIMPAIVPPPPPMSPRPPTAPTAEEGLAPPSRLADHFSCAGEAAEEAAGQADFAPGPALQTPAMAPAEAGGSPPVPSIVPPQYHVVQQTSVRPQSRGHYDSRWDADSETWHVTLFPARTPDGPEQVGHLQQCLEQMIGAVTGQAERPAPAAPAPRHPRRPLVPIGTEAPAEAAGSTRSAGRGRGGRGGGGGSGGVGGDNGGGGGSDGNGGGGGGGGDGGGDLGDLGDEGLGSGGGSGAPEDSGGAFGVDASDAGAGSDANGAGAASEAPPPRRLMDLRSLRMALRQSADAARTQKELRAIFAAGIHEIARQISTGHDGRGGLLMNVWSCAEELHAHVLEQRDSQVQRLSEDCARLAAELRTVRAKLGSVAGLETSHYSQAAELHRVQHSRNQLAATSESLQVRTGGRATTHGQGRG